MANLTEPYLSDPSNINIPSPNSCFLCGRDLEGCKSIEHVFPRWLLRRYNLWNKRLVLLNQTDIPYRSLTIPCCQECNNHYLSRLEEEVKHAIEKGIEGLLSIEEVKLFQWIAKMLYGILVKETFLLIDRKDGDVGTIVTSDMFDSLGTLHWFMQSVRSPIGFATNAWSIFRVKTFSYGDDRDFDFRDNPLLQTLSIRMGNVGIVAALQDNGIIKAYWDILHGGLDGITLHPLQFAELAAVVNYYAFLINRTPKYVSVTPSDSQGKTLVIPLPMQGISTKPIFDEWKDWEFARCFAAYLRNFPGLTEDSIYPEPNKIYSFLCDQDGAYRQLHPDFFFDQSG